MAIIVQKYGGTSVADANRINQVAQRIATTRDSGFDVVAVVSAMGNTTDKLIELAYEVTSKPEPREMDLLLSTGELVSCTLMAIALRDIGYPSISLTGFQAGIQTDTIHGRAHISRIDTARVLRELEEGKLVIVAGFQGITEDMDVTTLGRGGSDTTAVALAAALGASRCEVYTDVEGIYNADPRLVPQAKKLAAINYEEMLELASYGAKMHPRSIELAAVYNVPVYVASSFNDAPGTTIDCGVMELENRVKVTGIAHDRDVAKITVMGVKDQPGIAAALFEPLSLEGISVDTIVQNTGQGRRSDISFTVHRVDMGRARTLVEEVSRTLGVQGVAIDDSLAKVSIVGAGMQNTPGYAARMFRALADAGINIEMITTSEIRITCIIPETSIQDSATALYDAFNLANEKP